MNNFITLPLGAFETNCYLIQRGDNLYIIDPADDAPTIFEYAAKFNYKHAYILLTHGHVDHISAIEDLSKLMKIDDIYLHRDDEKLYHSELNQIPPYYPLQTNLPKTNPDFASKDFKIVHLPGHTTGGTGFLFDDIKTFFVSDTLFAGSIGRTDLPGGSYKTLIKSIEDKIFTLPDDYTFYSGHGPSNTIGNEKKTNPYVEG